jgi:hypothetical protein
MPTVAWIGPFRFFFYSNERGEPPHIHVRRDRCVAKFWLEPIALASSRNFTDRELRLLEDLVLVSREGFREAWREHLGH